jgi:DNA-binding SARP family transcriptional activator
MGHKRPGEACRKDYVEFRVLGPLEVIIGGRAADVGPPKQRALLALLILNADRVVSADRLIDELWGESPPDGARHALQVHVSNLRKLLEPSRAPGESPELLQTRKPGYVLRLTPNQSDAQRFESLVEEGRKAQHADRPERALSFLSEALGLWRGPALTDLIDEPFAQREADLLEELKLTATEDRLQAKLNLGHHSELVGELGALAARHPLRERISGMLMLALYRSGRQAEALQAFRRLKETLSNELGLDPSPELQGLEEGILQQAPELDWREIVERRDSAVKGREALAVRDWAAAFEMLSEVRQSESLGPDDFDALAEAAWWLGRLDDCIDARERAYDGFVGAGETERAALTALFLSLHHGDKGEGALAQGWSSRAKRLAGQDPNCAAQGYLVAMEAWADYHSGNIGGCISKGRQVTEIGQRCDDPTLVAAGIHSEGLGLIKDGRISDGWALLDESMVAASSGRLRSVWAGMLHCSAIMACEHLGDPRRAWQWIEATERWIRGFHQAVLFSGVCRMHKVRVIQQRGVWRDAEAQARRACEELKLVHGFTVGRGHYEIGEIRRLMGNYDAAEKLFEQAHQLGWEPQPGLALLRLAQGRTEAAVAGIRRALDEMPDRLARAGLLPHQVEVALAAGDLESAEAAADELDAIAEEYASAGMRAGAARARGAALLARPEPEAALTALRGAIRQWTEIGFPYETARARVLTAQACRLVGDEDGAAMELEAARKIFERLGAAPDASHVTDLLDRTAIRADEQSQPRQGATRWRAGRSKK